MPAAVVDFPAFSAYELRDFAGAASVDREAVSLGPGLAVRRPRVQALAGALGTSVLAVTGITNKSLRALMTGLLGGATRLDAVAKGVGQNTSKGKLAVNQISQVDLRNP